MAGPDLVADIGGTNARFGLISDEPGRVFDVRSFRVADFATIGDAVDRYIAAVGERPNNACFAVAAPVNCDVIEFTNSAWVLRPSDFQKRFQLQRLFTVNDFEALATSISALENGDFRVIKNAPGDPAAPKLVIGPGTGLGQALVVPCGKSHCVISTEGGHVTFAPRTEEEAAVSRILARRYSRVSVERLLSGPGLVNIHQALAEISNLACVPLRADEITAAAQNEGPSLEKAAVRIFFAVLGRVVGDAMLSTGARGGVVLGGGILPKIWSREWETIFMEQYLDKGRRRDYVDHAPLQMIINDSASLIGAAEVLRKKMQGGQ